MVAAVAALSTLPFGRYAFGLLRSWLYFFDAMKIIRKFDVAT
jgi:hypothetical protein